MAFLGRLAPSAWRSWAGWRPRPWRSWAG